MNFLNLFAIEVKSLNQDKDLETAITEAVSSGAGKVGAIAGTTFNVAKAGVRGTVNGLTIALNKGRASEIAALRAEVDELKSKLK